PPTENWVKIPDIKVFSTLNDIFKNYRGGIDLVGDNNQIIKNNVSSTNETGIRIAYSSIDIHQIPEMVNRIKLALNQY
ncbi:MAG: hypothetical protein ACFFC1_18725, partial [Promethearchaeota archaeon]